MKVVILVSADGEWKVMRSLLHVQEPGSNAMGESFVARLGKREVTFLHGGWGKVSAAATTQYAIDSLEPDLLVNLGTCGGFAGRIELGTIILVERTIIYDIVEQMTDASAAILHYSTELALDWLPEVLPTPVLRGLLVSGDRDIVVSDISDLVRKYDAVAADWESGAIAWVAKRNGKRLLILRGVSDIVSGEGGEAYGDYELFLRRTGEVLSELLDALPSWLDGIEARLEGQ